MTDIIVATPDRLRAIRGDAYIRVWVPFSEVEQGKAYGFKAEKDGRTLYWTQTPDGGEGDYVFFTLWLKDATHG